MNKNFIVYKDGMPFYSVTFPNNEADGLVIENLKLDQLINYINEKNIKSVYIHSMEDFSFLKQCNHLEHIDIELCLPFKSYSSLEKKAIGYIRNTMWSHYIV